MPASVFERPPVSDSPALPHFTASVLPLLNTLANAAIFAEPKSEDPRWNLAAVRIRIENDVLDAAATTSFILGQGRTAGTGTGDAWEVLITAVSLKPVIAALKRAIGEVRLERTSASWLRFTFGGQVFELPPAEGNFPNIDKLFPASTQHASAPGFSSFNPADLGRLGKLKDYTVTERRRHPVSSGTPLVLGLSASPDKPAVATFGPNFRILLGVRRGTVMPEEQAAAGGDHWRLDASS